jgi:hypothetical protein
LSNQPSPTEDEYDLIPSNVHPENININSLPSVLVSTGQSLLSSGLASLKGFIQKSSSDTSQNHL